MPGSPEARAAPVAKKVPIRTMKADTGGEPGGSCTRTVCGGVRRGTVMAGAGSPVAVAIRPSVGKDPNQPDEMNG